MFIYNAVKSGVFTTFQNTNYGVFGCFYLTKPSNMQI
nr:MAG TPA: hypothetical protein [Caudoviricetes sp.]